MWLFIDGMENETMDVNEQRVCFCNPCGREVNADARGFKSGRTELGIGWRFGAKLLNKIRLTAF